MRLLNDINLDIVMMDIDGTIKDLAKENTNALISAMKKTGNIDTSLRGKIVLTINKLSMYSVKIGLLPTNKVMLNMLLKIYCALLFTNYNKFKHLFYNEYNNEYVFFEDIDIIIKNMCDKNLRLYLVTSNSQNKNILKLKKDENRYACIMKYVDRLVVSKSRKYGVYKSIMQNNWMQKNEVLIVGDNFWDDVLPALILGCRVVWCNVYDSKLKKIVISILKVFNKNVYDDSELKYIEF